MLPPFGSRLDGHRDKKSPWAGEEALERVWRGCFALQHSPGTVQQEVMVPVWSLFQLVSHHPLPLSASQCHFSTASAERMLLLQPPSHPPLSPPADVPGPQCCPGVKSPCTQVVCSHAKYSVPQGCTPCPRSCEAVRDFPSSAQGNT